MGDLDVVTADNWDEDLLGRISSAFESRNALDLDKDDCEKTRPSRGR